MKKLVQVERTISMEPGGDKLGLDQVSDKMFCFKE